MDRERHGDPGCRSRHCLLPTSAPVLFGIGLLGVAYSTMPPSRRRNALLGLAVVSALAGLAALVSDLMGEVAGVALAASSLTLWLGSAHAVEARSVASAAGVVDRCGHGAGARDWRHPVGA